jgi:hypothetical protein
LVKRHPDSPNNRSRSVSHLIPYISQSPSRGRPSWGSRRTWQSIDGRIHVLVSTGCAFCRLV